MSGKFLANFKTNNHMIHKIIIMLLESFAASGEGVPLDKASDEILRTSD